jgi:hypothetical protein
MPRLRTRLRVAAALIAWVGMLALPLRLLAACPMLASGDDAAVGHRSSPLAAVDEHAGHDMAGLHATSPLAPASQEAPAHQHCPDLAHCAVAAVPMPPAMTVAPNAPAVALRVAAQAAPMSVARALEPPPPKA